MGIWSAFRRVVQPPGRLDGCRTITTAPFCEIPYLYIGSPYTLEVLIRMMYPLGSHTPQAEAWIQSYKFVFNLENPRVPGIKCRMRPSARSTE